MHSLMLTTGINIGVIIGVCSVEIKLRMVFVGGECKCMLEGNPIPAQLLPISHHHKMHPAKMWRKKKPSAQRK